jgi:hypothetical protein
MSKSNPKEYIYYVHILRASNASVKSQVFSPSFNCPQKVNEIARDLIPSIETITAGTIQEIALSRHASSKKPFLDRFVRTGAETGKVLWYSVGKNPQSFAPPRFA